VYPTLDRLTYYQLLRLQPNADAAAIRASYYRMAATLHPDRYHNLPDAVIRDQLITIVARINEGYRVLISPEKRVAYDALVQKGKTRLDQTSERASAAPKNPEDSLKDPQAKKFFRMGVMCLTKKDFRGAVMNFNFAKNYEPAGAVIAEKLAEAQAGVAAAKAGTPPAK
jgi:curved DNA-binding protein CbpA